MKIAVIGSGVSGLGAAYLLAPRHDVTVYEKNSYLGGHSRTIEVPAGDAQLAIDTGFIVFNDRNYPHLRKLFQTLGIRTEKSDMSYAVSMGEGRLEYSSHTLFAQRKNLVRPAFWKMLADILRFHGKAERCLDDPSMTLGECLEYLRMGDWFRRYYLLPMGAAIWSCPIETITRFPAHRFLRFFKNHGLLSLHDSPQWYTVKGGSRVYVERLRAACRAEMRSNCAALRVRSAPGQQAQLRDSTGNTEQFDHIVFACHADEALRLLDAPSEPLRAMLGSFRYCENHIIVHKDTDFMPRRRSCWSSWNCLGSMHDGEQKLSVSYWMNRLQNLDRTQPVFVTLNPMRRPRRECIFDEHTFSHPVFDAQALAAQQTIAALQGRDGLWFCGAWQDYGFHEDGLLSAVRVAQGLGAPLPW